MERRGLSFFHGSFSLTVWLRSTRIHRFHSSKLISSTKRTISCTDRGSKPFQVKAGSQRASALSHFQQAASAGSLDCSELNRSIEGVKRTRVDGNDQGRR